MRLPEKSLILHRLQQQPVYKPVTNISIAFGIPVRDFPETETRPEGEIKQSQAANF
ncbi:hypothetical protein HUW51_17215 [Adhaeribacter swui]|uniref:Uncharacterized protein n=1 Tax=Adhaeribacter swui TaxID=2086471 RepID=A0A7G7GB43_9BACT|nr:hypothetical protein [Adhaeribacter swui]QNF34377.1 hypothetical protein HUW51_17215 [Adhaeribacter swui]